MAHTLICHCCGLQGVFAERLAILTTLPFEKIGKCSSCGAKKVPLCRKEDFDELKAELPPKHDVNILISEVLTNFDFERVHRFMKAMNWCWHVPHAAPTVPTLMQIKEAAVRLIQRAAENPGAVVFSSGGFQVEVVGLDEETGEFSGLKVSFVLEDVEVWWEDLDS